MTPKDDQSSSGQHVQERIRVICLVPAMTRGGTERQLIELLCGLDRERFDPTLVVFGDAKRDASYDPGNAVDRVLSLSISPGGNFRARNAPGLVLGMLRLTGILRDIRPHVVHAFLPAPAVIGAIACKCTGVSTFLVGRRSMASYHRRGSRLLTWFDRLPLKFASGLVGNCKAIAEEAVAVDKVPLERTFIIYNGVNTESFRQGKDIALRAQLGFGPNAVVFGMIANFHYIKRHIDFIQAAEQIHKIDLDARFLMVGADQGELPSLRREIRARGLDSSIAVVEGTSEPERYYRAMDVYISTSEVEGMSNSIMEAMATGKPVIATNVGGNPELVIDGETGFLVPSHAPQEIAARASTMLADSAMRNRMGQTAIRVVEERFTVKAMVRAHEELYQMLVSAATSRRSN
jgi:glycosyltransferase involved in cell wall biosynthesis